MRRKKTTRWLSQLLLILSVCISSPGFAKDALIYTSLFSKVAVGGYDTVAYFTDGKPIKGDPSFTTNHQGAEWRFASAANRMRFIADPEKYAPQYGGYCAWAVSQGSTASGDPLRWRIVSDKLYLNYDEAVQKKWDASPQDFIQKANNNWPKVLD
jgi:hypothetical protein